MLCLAVMLSVMVVGAGAAFSDQDKIENTEAVDACSALNIINGYEDGAFHPERNIKRAEVTKMICVALNGGEEPNTSTNAKPTFTDVRGTIYAWAEGYIEACVAQGIVDGVGGTRFAPAGNVTAAQLAKMLLVSLGYNATTEKFTGNAWETNVNVRASQKHLYDGLEKMDTSAAVTRDQAAQMVWNALQAYEVEYRDGVLQDKVVGSTNDKITLLRDRYDAWVYVGTLTKVDSTNITINMTPADCAASDPKPDDKGGDVEFTKVGQDYSALMGQKVKVLFKNGKTNDVIGAYATDDNTVYAVPANGTEKDGDKVKFNGNSYSVELVNGGIKTYVDGQPSDPTTLAQLDANDLNPNLYTFVDTDDNNKLDTLIVKTYNVAQVTYAASDKIIANGKTYKTADENIAKDLKKDDWVVITENLYKDQKDIVKVDVQTAKLDALRDTASGKIHFDGKANVDAKWNEYKIGDTWYKAGDKLVQSNLSENDLKTVKAGQSVDYVAVNGVIFSIEKSTGENVGRVADVALVLAKNNNNLKDEVKLAFFDGTTDTVKVDKVYTDNNGTKGSFDKDLDPGVVYEYSISNGKYSFEPLQSGDKFEEYYGDLTYRGKKTAANVSADKATVDGYKVDDNAQVLLYANGESKKLTGKQFKHMTATIKPESAVYAFSGDMNGLDRIGALAVTVNSLDGIVKTWGNYGYIVTKPAKLDGNKTIQYTIWTKDGNITVQEEKSNLVDRDKGTVIGFDTLTELPSTPSGDNKATHLIDDVEKLDAGEITFTAIVDGNDKTVKFAASPVGATNDKTYELDVAGTVLYIDSDADDDLAIGLEKGSLDAAQKIDGKWQANALVIGNGGDIELLIVDQGSYLKNDIYKNYVKGENTVYGDDTAVEPPVEGTFRVTVTVDGKTDATLTKDIKKDTAYSATYTAPEGKIIEKVSANGTISADKKTATLAIASVTKAETIAITLADEGSVIPPSNLDYAPGTAELQSGGTTINVYYYGDVAPSNADQATAINNAKILTKTVSTVVGGKPYESVDGNLVEIKPSTGNYTVTPVEVVKVAIDTADNVVAYSLSDRNTNVEIGNTGYKYNDVLLNGVYSKTATYTVGRTGGLSISNLNSSKDVLLRKGYQLIFDTSLTANDTVYSEKEITASNPGTAVAGKSYVSDGVWLQVKGGDTAANAKLSLFVNGKVKDSGTAGSDGSTPVTYKAFQFNAANDADNKGVVKLEEKGGYELYIDGEKVEGSFSQDAGQVLPNSYDGKTFVVNLSSDSLAYSKSAHDSAMETAEGSVVDGNVQVTLDLSSAIPDKDGKIKITSKDEFLRDYTVVTFRQGAPVKSFVVVSGTVEDKTAGSSVTTNSSDVLYYVKKDAKLFVTTSDITSSTALSNTDDYMTVTIDGASQPTKVTSEWKENTTYSAEFTWDVSGKEAVIAFVLSSKS